MLMLTVLESLVCGLKQHALLWVDGGRLTWGDVEERGIERLDVTLDEVSPAKTNRALPLATGVVEAVDVDAIRWKFRPSVVTSLEHLEERLNVFAISREPASHANNGDGHDLV